MSVRVLPLVIGVALAASGVLLLLSNLGLVPEGISLWPVVLIAIGVVVLTAGLQRGADATPETAAVPLDGADEARLVLKHGAGVLDVAGAAQSGHLFDGSFAGGVRQDLQREGDRLQVTLRHPADPDRLVRQHRGLRWTLALTREVPVDLELQTGASRVSLNLEAHPVRHLRVQTGASEVDVRLPARGRCTARVSAGAAEVRLHVPQGVAASIASRSALASVDIDEARFPAWGGGYRSPDYDTADDRVDVELEGGVASFRVD